MDILKPNRSNFSIAGLFFLTATILLLALPATAMAQDPARNYGTAVQNPLQRTLDAYGKGPFCAGCHNIPYPLPPEGPVSPSTYPVEDTKAEAGLKRLISSRGRDVGAVYSPEGGRIVWVTESLGNWTIWIMNEDGADKQQLTPSNVISGWPSWSPDGKKIAFESDRAGSFDIWRLSLDRPLTVNVEFETCAAKGETAKALMTVGASVSHEAIRIENIELQFDWEKTGDHLEVSLPPTTISDPSNPLRIPVGFKVPDDDASGYHFYHVKVQYLTVDASSSDLRMTYEHSGGDLEVDIPERRQCDLLFIELGGKLDALHRRAIDESAQLGLTTSEVALPLKGYFDYLLKPEARPFLESNNEFRDATRLYLAGDYPSALAHFENVRAQVSRQSTEKSGDQTVIDRQALLAFLPLIFVIAPLVVYIRRSNRLTRKS